LTEYYYRVRNGIVQPTYLGARMINQSVGEWQWSTAPGELAKVAGLPAVAGSAAKTIAVGAIVKHYGLSIGMSGGIAMLAVDVFIGSIFATYRSPKRYSCGWPGFFDRDINPNIPLN
jgi:hypothetical protein